MLEASPRGFVVRGHTINPNPGADKWRRLEVLEVLGVLEVLEVLEGCDYKSFLRPMTPGAASQSIINPDSAFSTPRWYVNHIQDLAHGDIEQTHRSGVTLAPRSSWAGFPTNYDVFLCTFIDH